MVFTAGINNKPSSSLTGSIGQVARSGFGTAPPGTGGIKPSPGVALPVSSVQATGGMNKQNLGMVGQLYNQGIQGGSVQNPGVGSMGAKAMLSGLLGVDKGSMGKRKMIKQLYANAGLSSDKRMTNQQMLNALLAQNQSGGGSGGTTPVVPTDQPPQEPVQPAGPNWQGMPTTSFMANA